MDIKPQDQRAPIKTSGPLDTLLKHLIEHNEMPDLLVRRVVAEMTRYRIRPEGAHALIKALNFMCLRACTIIKYMEEHFRDDYCYSPNIVEDIGDGRAGLAMIVRSTQPFDGVRVLPYFTIVASAWYPAPGTDLSTAMSEPEPTGLVGWEPTRGGVMEIGLTQEILDDGAALLAQGVVPSPSQVDSFEQIPNTEIICKRYGYLLSDNDILIAITENLLFSTQHVVAKVDGTIEKAEVVSLR